MEKTMTKKEMFAFIAETLADNAEVVAFCENEIALLTKKSEKAKATAAAKREAGDALRERVLATLTDEFMSIADIVDAIGDEEVTAAKVTYRANALVKAGLAVKEDAKVEVEGGKSKTVKVFRLA